MQQTVNIVNTAMHSIHANDSAKVMHVGLATMTKNLMKRLWDINRMSVVHHMNSNFRDMWSKTEEGEWNLRDNNNKFELTKRQ